MFIGWFLLNAARAEAAQVLATDALAAVRVRDVMAPVGPLAPAWMTVDAFIDRYVGGSRLSVFPVQAPDGQVEGLVTRQRLQAVPPRARAVTHVAAVELPLAAFVVAGPDEALVEVLSRVAADGGEVALIFDHDHLVGTLSAADVGQAAHPGVLRTTRLGEAWRARASNGRR